jgi:alpha-beta hydrolase superfamily lysophospholipase
VPPEPRLIETVVPDEPEGAVLVLHGGGDRRGSPAVSPTQLSVVRMVPVARTVARHGHGRLAVFRLLNTTRGWAAGHTPVDDARWALGAIADRLGGRLPTCLVGHSLGGRAALLAARAPEVRSVVALAPWVSPSDAPTGLDGRRILVVHGTDDRIASPERSAALARRLEAAGADVRYVSVRGGTHAMLRRRASFDGLAAEFAATTLLDVPARGTLARLEAGEPWITT